MLVERHVFHTDLGKPGGQQLLAWCRARGADCFTFAVVGSSTELEREAALIEAPLQPFRLSPTTIRREADGQPGSYWTNPSALWTLNDTTESILLSLFHTGLLSYLPTEGNWCEDPCLFREGELMLGVISHEDEGILRIHDSEQVELDKANIRYRLEGEWVGY